MRFKICCSFLLLIITTFLCYETIAQPELYPSCSNDNYTKNSTYQQNLNTLLSTLTSNTEITYGFYNFSYGKGNNKVYAIGLCRGDVNPNDCRRYLNNSRVLLTQNCPNQKEAIIWTDNCMLRYSNRSIFGLMESKPELFAWNALNVTKVGKYNKVLLGNLLYDLKTEAASGDYMKKYAVGNVTGNITGSNFRDIYSLMQCTPDMSSLECNECLEQAIDSLPSEFESSIGARVMKPSCNIRYESYLFYALPVHPPPPHTPASTNHSSSQGIYVLTNSIFIIIIIIFSESTMIDHGVRLLYF
ncbi:putative Gnk2-like domain-containing protein [Medicago truncatula]|uniref:Putative Gnk2-like domain-containing protein n=1 Tax=Medicago truncatula TaxID=3880 RepID=A0A396HSN2_MEDTR|nr:putative Gnk2-like domain-containing protein [Medicago truncatula]